MGQSCVNIPAVARAFACSVAALASAPEYASGRNPCARRTRLTAATSVRARSGVAETAKARVGDELLYADETLAACGDDGGGVGQLVVNAGSTETHAGGSTGTGPVSAEPATGSAPAPSPRTSAMNHLERLRPTIHSSSDSCHGRRKGKATKPAAIHSNEGWSYCAAGTASCVQTVPSSTGAGHSGSRVDVLATTQTSE